MAAELFLYVARTRAEMAHAEWFLRGQTEDPASLVANYARRMGGQSVLAQSQSILDVFTDARQTAALSAASYVMIASATSTLRVRKHDYEDSITWHEWLDGAMGSLKTDPAERTRKSVTGPQSPGGARRV